MNLNATYIWVQQLMLPRTTSAMKSNNAALASPSRAGASICTPTASSPTSEQHHHQQQNNSRNRITKTMNAKTKSQREFSDWYPNTTFLNTIPYHTLLIPLGTRMIPLRYPLHTITIPSSYQYDTLFIPLWYPLGTSMIRRRASCEMGRNATL
jgi:hypothetical protein